MSHYIVDIKIVIPVFSLLGIICIVSNALVCCISISRKAPNGVIKYYIFSLAITDILVGAVCIPLYLYIEWTLYSNQMPLLKRGEAYYSVLLFSEVFLSTSSVLHLCLMAYDRVMAVSKPMYHRRKLRRKSTALKLLTIPWLLALVNAILSRYLFEKPINYTALVAVAILFPSCFITSCYSVLLHKIRKRNRSFSNVQNMQQINEKRIIKTMLAVVITFAFCWMPTFVFCVYYAVNIKHLPYNAAVFFMLSEFMQYLNSACNPFIYAVFNPAFRSAANTALRSVRRRFKLSSSGKKMAIANVRNNLNSMETKL